MVDYVNYLFVCVCVCMCGERERRIMIQVHLFIIKHAADGCRLSTRHVGYWVYGYAWTFMYSVYGRIVYTVGLPHVGTSSIDVVGVVAPVVRACGDWLREKRDSSLFVLSLELVRELMMEGVEMERSRDTFLQNKHKYEPTSTTIELDVLLHVSRFKTHPSRYVYFHCHVHVQVLLHSDQYW